MSDTKHPYAPPIAIDTGEPRLTVLGAVGQAGAVLYGIALTSLFVWMALISEQDSEPLLETVVWLLAEATLCFGVFAYALPQLQTRLVANVWRYTWFLPSAILSIGVAWETWSDAELSHPVGFAFVFVIFLLAFGPGFVLNFLLHRKLASFRKQTPVSQDARLRVPRGPCEVSVPQRSSMR